MPEPEAVSRERNPVGITEQQDFGGMQACFVGHGTMPLDPIAEMIIRAAGFTRIECLSEHGECSR